MTTDKKDGRGVSRGMKSEREKKRRLFHHFLYTIKSEISVMLNS